MISGSDSKIGIVILNYNSYKLTCDLATTCAQMNIFDYIVIIDNNSNDTFEDFISSKNFDIIYKKSDSNGGYAKGNNLGLKILNENKCDIAFVANPDVFISKDCIEMISNFLISHREYALASCSRSSSNNGLTGQYWWIPNFRYTVIESLYFGRRYLNKKCIKLTNNVSNFTEDYFEVEVVGGAFWGCNLEILKKLNYLDEHTFLWYEENILAYKVKKQGYKVGFLTRCHYIHNHIQKGHGNRNMELFIQSKKYYCVAYLKINKIQRAILLIVDSIGVFEEKIICLLFQK